MSLKRTGNLSKSLLYALLALVLLGYQGVVVWHLVTAGDWGGLFNLALCGFLPIAAIFVFVLLLVDMILVAWPIILIVRERALRALAVADPKDAPVAARQPDLALALAPGGQLVLERRRVRPPGARSMVAGTFGAGLAILLGVLCGELLVVPVLHPFRDWIGQTLVPLLTQPPQAPTPLDWAAFALPIALTLLGVILTSISGARARWERITADDTGITIEGPLRRPRAIPWSDVLVFARSTGSKQAKPDGTYVLWGRQHLLGVTIHGKAFSVGAGARATTQWEYAGGYERYAEDAHRLLATICVRASVPLRTMARAERAASSVKRRFPSTLDLDDALAAPLAGPDRQPAPGAVEAARKSSGRVALRPRLPWFPILVDTLLVAVSATIALLLWTQHPLGTMAAEPLLHANDPALPFELLAIIGLGGLMFGAVGWVFTYSWRRRRAPIIIADEIGLTVQSGTSNQNMPSTIRWGDLRAWGMVASSPDRKRAPFYIAWAEGSKLTWVEPDGARLAGRDIVRDRRAAYRQMAEQLHALIVARSGQAMREIDLAKPLADG